MAGEGLELAPLTREEFLDRLDDGETVVSIRAATGLTSSQIRLWERDQEFLVRYRRATLMQLQRSGPPLRVRVRARVAEPSEEDLNRFLQIASETGLVSVACSQVEGETGRRFPAAYVARMRDPANKACYRPDVAEILNGVESSITSRVRDGLVINALTPTDKNPGGNPTAQRIWLESQDPDFQRHLRVSPMIPGSLAPEVLGEATSAQADRIAAAGGGRLVEMSPRRSEGGDDGET